MTRVCKPILLWYRYARSASSGGKFHEAGYDAYCTGVCFARMRDYFARLYQGRHGSRPYENKLNLMRSAYNLDLANATRDTLKMEAKGDIYHVQIVVAGPEHEAAANRLKFDDIVASISDAHGGDGLGAANKFWLNQRNLAIEFKALAAGMLDLEPDQLSQKCSETAAINGTGWHVRLQLWSEYETMRAARDSAGGGAASSTATATTTVASSEPVASSSFFGNIMSWFSSKRRSDAEEGNDADTAEESSRHAKRRRVN